MNKQEALTVLEAKLDEYRRHSYAELRARIGQNEVVELTAPSGPAYTMEILVLWDAKPEGDLRVCGSVDDGGWRAWIPLCRDLLMCPDGRVC